MGTVYCRSRHAVYSMNAHIVLVPKYRRRIITDHVRAILDASIRDTASRMSATITALDGEIDHLHILLAYHPSMPLAKFVAAAKANSARKVLASGLPEIRKCLYRRQFWSTSYFAASIGGAPLDVVKAYVENQRH